MQELSFIHVQLCDGLVDGGVTPSLGKIEAVCEAVTIPVHVLIRPRPGDFCYSAEEANIMLRDIRHCKLARVSGVVIGALDVDGNVDIETMRLLIDEARPMSVTFHRAIDVCNDPIRALQICIELGVSRVLSSGQAATALEGAAMLASMVKIAGEKCVVLAGGGVRYDNVRKLIEATGVSEVHSTARVSVPSQMRFRPDPPVYMGGEKVNSPETEFTQRVVTIESAAAMNSALRDDVP